MFKVSVLRGTKANPELVKITDILADRFALTEPEGKFAINSYGIAFYIDQSSFFSGTKSSIVAFLPGTDWVVEHA